MANYTNFIVDETPEDLAADVIYQIGALEGVAAAAGIVPANITAQAAIINVVCLILLISIKYNVVPNKLWSP